MSANVIKPKDKRYDVEGIINYLLASRKFDELAGKVASIAANSFKKASPAFVERAQDTDVYNITEGQKQQHYDQAKAHNIYKNRNIDNSVHFTNNKADMKGSLLTKLKKSNNALQSQKDRPLTVNNDELLSNHTFAEPDNEPENEKIDERNDNTEPEGADGEIENKTNEKDELNINNDQVDDNDRIPEPSDIDQKNQADVASNENNDKNEIQDETPSEDHQNEDVSHPNEEEKPQEYDRPLEDMDQPEIADQDRQEPELSQENHHDETDHPPEDQQSSPGDQSQEHDHSPETNPQKEEGLKEEQKGSLEEKDWPPALKAAVERYNKEVGPDTHSGEGKALHSEENAADVKENNIEKELDKTAEKLGKGKSEENVEKNEFTGPIFRVRDEDNDEDNKVSSENKVFGGDKGRKSDGSHNVSEDQKDQSHEDKKTKGKKDITVKPVLRKEGDKWFTFVEDPEYKEYHEEMASYKKKHPYNPAQFLS